MSDEPSTKIHRRCSKCGEIVRTASKKSFKCPLCGTRNRIRHRAPVKAPEKKTYMKAELDRFAEHGPP